MRKDFFFLFSGKRKKREPKGKEFLEKRTSGWRVSYPTRW
jgi:hypothetical protein